jgi:AhpD family alkylhydroperoxidase
VHEADQPWAVLDLTDPDLLAGEDLAEVDRYGADAEVKALIGLAVVAQIPCSYCIWADAESAKAAGASEEEIHEAVAIAATERYGDVRSLLRRNVVFRTDRKPILCGKIPAGLRTRQVDSNTRGRIRFLNNYMYVARIKRSTSHLAV